MFIGASKVLFEKSLLGFTNTQKKMYSNKTLPPHGSKLKNTSLRLKGKGKTNSGKLSMRCSTLQRPEVNGGFCRISIPSGNLSTSISESGMKKK